MNRQIVSHLIAGYPSIEGSFSIAKGLIDGGAHSLEVQIPFSDPSADGPTIEEACSKALSRGFKVEQGFELIKRIKKYNNSIPVFIMSYASIVFTMGVREFVVKSKECGVHGLIIPDLTIGSDEDLYRIGLEEGIEIVPVLVTSIPEKRLNDIMIENNSSWVYIALRGGITGSYTTITNENLDFLDKVRSYGVKIMAGFGIQSKDQIDVLDEHVEASVVGSYFVKISDGNENLENKLKEAIKSLI